MEGGENPTACLVKLVFNQPIGLPTQRVYFKQFHMLRLVILECWIRRSNSCSLDLKTHCKTNALPCISTSGIDSNAQRFFSFFVVPPSSST